MLDREREELRPADRGEVSAPDGSAHSARPDITASKKILDEKKMLTRLAQHVVSTVRLFCTRAL